MEKRDLSHRKIFREINALVTSKLLISRNFCQKSMRENYRNFHTVQCGSRFLRKSQINILLKKLLRVDFTEIFRECSDCFLQFSKNVAFTKYLPKKVIENFHTALHHS